MNFRTIQILLLLFVGIASCKKDKPPVRPKEENTVSPVNGTTELKGIFITNEGNFQFGNAAVSFINAADNAVTKDLYKDQNSVSIGDVAQSINKIDGNYYIVVNNSSKIEIVDPVNFKSIGKVTGLTSPRFIEKVATNKAYVTDLYANAINIVDLNSKQKIGSIACGGWTEELVKLNNKVYVTNMNTEYLYIIDIASDVIEDSIHLVKAPSSIIVDANNNLWVLSSGSTSSGILAALQKINSTTKQVDLTLTFSSTDSPKKIKLNAAKSSLYILNKGVQKMNINDTSLPTSTLISQGTKVFYGLGIDPITENIFVSDAVDYVQQGWVLKYTSVGLKTDSFKVGIIPGEFYFNY